MPASMSASSQSNGTLINMFIDADYFSKNVKHLYPHTMLQWVIIWLLGLRGNQNQVSKKDASHQKHSMTGVIKRDFSLWPQIIPPDAVCQCHQRQTSADLQGSVFRNCPDVWQLFVFLISSQQQKRKLLQMEAGKQNVRTCNCKTKSDFCLKQYHTSKHWIQLLGALFIH